MLLIFVTLVLCVAALSALFFAWTMWMQTYLYTQAVEGLAWRAPVAAVIVVASFVVWEIAAKASPGQIRPLQEAGTAKDAIYFKELAIVDGEGNVEIFRRTGGDRTGYRGTESNKSLPTYPGEIRVKEKDEDKEFTVSFKRVNPPKGDPYYEDAQGRQMDSTYLGTIKEKQQSRFFSIVFLNLVHVLAWILAFGPILAFGSGHAIVMGLSGAALANFTILPYLIRQVEALSQGS